MRVLLRVYENSKYDPAEPKPIDVCYKGVASIRLVEPKKSPKEVREIEKRTDGHGIDPAHQYLILRFDDGLESTFGNSRVELFQERVIS